MPPAPDYLDFDLELTRAAEGAYTARVLGSPKGEAETLVRMPVAGVDLENVILKLGRTRSGVRSLGSPQQELAKQFGTTLYDAVFSGEVGTCFRRSIDAAESAGKGLRVKLRLTDVPALGDIPWEYLYAEGLGRFLVLSGQTPIVRYLDLPREVPPLAVTPPLRVLLAVCSPSNLAQLDTAAEVDRVAGALRELIDAGLVVVDPIAGATLADLRHALRRNDYHVLHFIGHGGFDPVAGDGVLAFEDGKGLGHLVSGGNLGTLLHDFRTLRLAVLNACEGARQSPTDPFSGVAQALVRQGLPAVVAMQFEITDVAATTFSHEFYAALADGYPIDAALAQARLGVFSSDNDVEWGTPVLYLRARDGRIFDVAAPAASVPAASVPASSVPAAPVPAPSAVADAGSRGVGDRAAQPVVPTARRDTPAPQPGDRTAPLSEVGSGSTPRRPVGHAAAAYREPGAPGGAGGVGAPPATVTGADATTVARRPRTAWYAVLATLLVVAAGVAIAVLRPRPQDAPVGPPAPAPTGVVVPAPGSTGKDPAMPLAGVLVVQPGTVTVDGDPSDWGSGAEIPGSVRISGWDTKLKATWRLKWDKDRLYLLARVLDRALVPADQATPSQQWRGDSVSFELGPDVRGLGSGTGLRPLDAHWIFGLPASLPGSTRAVVNPKHPSKNNITGGTFRDGTLAAFTSLPVGYLVEAQIPWSATGLVAGAPKAGEVFGANLDVSDAQASNTVQDAMYSTNALRTGVAQTLPATWQALQLG